MIKLQPKLLNSVIKRNINHVQLLIVNLTDPKLSEMEASVYIDR